MLWTIALLFLVLWGVAYATSYTMGGFVHLLLALALATLLVRHVWGRRELASPATAKAKEPR